MQNYRNYMNIIQIERSLVAAVRETEKAVLLKVVQGSPHSGAQAWFPKAALTLHVWDQDGLTMYYAEVAPSLRLSREQQAVIGG